MQCAARSASNTRAMLLPATPRGPRVPALGASMRQRVASGDARSAGPASKRCSKPEWHGDYDVVLADGRTLRLGRPYRETLLGR